MNKSALKNYTSYNKSDSLIFIANYPVTKEGELKNLSGVAWYTKHMAEAVKIHLDRESRKIIILAEVLDKEEAYEKDGILVCRCWSRGSLSVYSNLLNAISFFSKVDKIFIQFEFNIFGEGIVTLFFARFLLALKLKKKNVTLLLHQAITNLSDLDGHLNLKRKSLKMGMLNIIMRRFLSTILSFPNKVIVHDKILKDRALSIYKRPIFVIPLGLEDQAAKCELIEARDKLGIGRHDFVVLCFGFLTWYKGSDWIVDKFVEYYKNVGDTSVKLVMAGGKSANLKGKKFYEDYYSGVLEKAKLSPNIIVTGFVKEEDVPNYFCAADVVVLSYRVQMSASGPFAHALAYDRPFLLSEELEGVLETFDIKEKLAEVGLKPSDLLFSMKDMDLFNKLGRLIENKSLRDLQVSLSESVKNERSWDKIGKQFLNVIDA